MDLAVPERNVKQISKKEEPEYRDDEDILSLDEGDSEEE